MLVEPLPAGVIELPVRLRRQHHAAPANAGDHVHGFADHVIVAQAGRPELAADHGAEVDPRVQVGW